MRQSNEIETNATVTYMCTIGLHTAISYCSILYKTIKYKRDDHYLSSQIEINKVTYSHATFLFKWWNFIALILFKLYYLDLLFSAIKYM